MLNVLHGLSSLILTTCLYNKYDFFSFGAGNGTQRLVYTKHVHLALSYTLDPKYEIFSCQFDSWENLT